MIEIGDTLREARIRKGLNIKDVEAALKIRSRYLQALEEDDFEVIPGPAFVKGFLRTYATYLRLDADSLVDSYRSRFEPRSENTRDFSSIRATRPPARPRATRPHRSQRGYVLLGVVAVVVIAAAAWFGLGVRGEEPAELESASLSSSSTTAEASSGSSVPSTVSTDGSGGAGSTESTAGSAGERINLKLRVSRSTCALVVRESSAEGKVLYQGQLAEGENLEYASAGAYWMNVGNPTVLVVTVNGKVYPLKEPYGTFVAGKEGVERLE